MVFSVIVWILMVVSNWIIFTKMGREGWESLIPIYSTYVLFKELYGSGVLRLVLLLVPLVNVYIAFRLFIDLAHAFNKSTAFALGLIFLSVIFFPILAFGDATYIKSIPYTNIYE